MRVEIVDGFLSEDECSRLIEMARQRLEPSTSWNVLKGSSEVSSYRISDQMFFTVAENELVASIERRISDMTRMPIGNGEGLQVVHYSKGGYYKKHGDYFESMFGANNRVLERGGQRVITVLMYLNDVAAGGETFFPKTKLSIKPIRGRAAIWYNVDERGRVDKSTMHSAEPVLEGEKWIATKWLREAEFV